MFEVKIMNRTNKKVFTREFNSRKDFLNYVRKVKFSKVLTLLSAIDNSYLYD